MHFRFRGEIYMNNYYTLLHNFQSTIDDLILVLLEYFLILKPFYFENKPISNRKINSYILIASLRI